MFLRFLWVGVMAGILAGVPTAAIQHVTTTPLILAAEFYENSEASHHAAAHQFEVINANVILVHGDINETEEEAWAPDNGLERTFYTSIATIITTIGYSLMLLAAMFLAKGKISPRSGLIWGLAGFTATGLAPSLGLSPELPGAAAADLTARQMWWGGTVVATAVGLWLVLRVSKIWAIILGICVIGLPHLIGAPQPVMLTSEVPSELAAHFASSSLVLHAIAWVFAGCAVGFVWQRQEKAAEG
ncbi:MAG: CbtA family protein [Sneathiella sp.]|uniref:CbtA family protein n=1 Tax=Sneathiella sp. TaxID=1964365 RepID=UPI003002E90D